MVKSDVKKNNENELPTINIGMVGHIDHGKTTLLYKLSGKWASTHSEELKRGITIKLGYADIVIYKDEKGYNREGRGKAIRHVSFIDAPGHEMLMATMLSGAAMIDGAILVIAANEGIKPQTIEHLAALQAKKVKNLIIVQNKIDLVDIEQARKNYNDIMELLKGKYDNVPIIPVSALQDINIDKIYEAIVNIPISERKTEGEPIFLVARSFDINKPGTKPENLHGAVLGGTLKQGILKVGDEIEIKPGMVIREANQLHYKTLKTKIVSLFRGTKKVDKLTPGGSMSIETELDMTIGKNDALAGCVVSHVGKLPEITTNISIKYQLFPEVYGTIGHEKINEIKVSEMLMLSINTSMSVGIVKKVKKDVIEFSLKIPIVSFRGDNVGIARNINNHWRLIGYGEIL
ncbi:MAG: translation initiation factor IF-2 subunit gamma [Candidatus Pacearchaeota archaeon]|nr:translation initiation factor IF-2 subunit gamma [Candidatus Pacearchaeota archaeon]